MRVVCEHYTLLHTVYALEHPHIMLLQDILKYPHRHPEGTVELAVIADVMWVKV